MVYIQLRGQSEGVILRVGAEIHLLEFCFRLLQPRHLLNQPLKQLWIVGRWTSGMTGSMAVAVTVF